MNKPSQCVVYSSVSADQNWAMDVLCVQEHLTQCMHFLDINVCKHPWAHSKVAIKSLEAIESAQKKLYNFIGAKTL